MPAYTVIRNEPSGTDLRWLSFDRVPSEHTEPGQFISAKVGEADAYFAIASSPGQPLELLIKASGEVGVQVAALQPGQVLEGSGAIGKGFRAAATRPRPLVCLVNGSALAAVRPVLEAECAAGLPRPVTLLLGVLSADRVPFADDLARWADQGVDVDIVLDKAAAGWTGSVGFVQLVAEARGLMRDDVAVVCCGVPPMQKHAASMYAEAGLDSAFFLTNF